jgi:hypothetical protein
LADGSRGRVVPRCRPAGDESRTVDLTGTPSSNDDDDDDDDEEEDVDDDDEEEDDERDAWMSCGLAFCARA